MLGIQDILDIVRSVDKLSWSVSQIELKAIWFRAKQLFEFGQGYWFMFKEEHGANLENIKTLARHF